MPLKIVDLQNRIQRQVHALEMAGLPAYTVNLGTTEYAVLRGMFVSLKARALPRTGHNERMQWSYMGCILNVFPGELCVVLPAPFHVLNNTILIEELLCAEKEKHEKEEVARFLVNNGPEHLTISPQGLMTGGVLGEYGEGI